MINLEATSNGARSVWSENQASSWPQLSKQAPHGESESGCSCSCSLLKRYFELKQSSLTSIFTTNESKQLTRYNGVKHLSVVFNVVVSDSVVGIGVVAGGNTVASVTGSVVVGSVVVGSVVVVVAVVVASRGSRTRKSLESLHVLHSRLWASSTEIYTGYSLPTNYTIYLLYRKCYTLSDDKLYVRLL